MVHCCPIMTISFSDFYIRFFCFVFFLCSSGCYWCCGDFDTNIVIINHLRRAERCFEEEEKGRWRSRNGWWSSSFHVCPFSCMLCGLFCAFHTFWLALNLSCWMVSSVVFVSYENDECFWHWHFTYDMTHFGHETRNQPTGNTVIGYWLWTMLFTIFISKMLRRA